MSRFVPLIVVLGLIVNFIPAALKAEADDCGCNTVETSQAYLEHFDRLLADEPGLTEEQSQIVTALVWLHNARVDGDLDHWMNSVSEILEGRVREVFTANELVVVFAPALSKTGASLTPAGGIILGPGDPPCDCTGPSPIPDCTLDPEDDAVCSYQDPCNLIQCCGWTGMAWCNGMCVWN